MTRRGWIVLASVVAIVLAIALTPFLFHQAVRAWTRHEILRIANEPPNYEVLPTDNALKALTKRARKASHDRDYQRAVDLYTQGIDDSSTDAKTRRDFIRQRAFAYEDLHQYDRAEADYSAMLAIEPLDPDVYAKRGFYFIRRGRHDEALADFRKGGELVPADGGFPYGEGQTYEKLGQHDKAVERYTEAIRRNATVTTYYRERGSAYNYLGKFREALADYDKALELGYALPFPRETGYSNLGRGYALLHLEQYRRAIDDFDAVLKVVPRSSNALGWRGAAYQSLGNGRQAVADYKAAVAIDPKNPSALAGLKQLEPAALPPATP
jgi:tetratricopeptide (TPR) repeat protein